MIKKTLLLTLLLLTLAIQPASALIKLDNIYYDPAIVASGDEVDIVVQFHTIFSTVEEDRIDNPDFTFDVEIRSDDTLTEKYVTIQDAYGDDLHGAIYTGDHYNKKFRIKVSQDAPAGSYEFKLVGVWYENGELLEGEQYIKFELPVKKEGIVLGIGAITTTPAEVRPGDDYVHVVATVENSGEKAAKAVELTLETPDGLKASYTNNNRVWVGMVEAGARQQVSFYLDVDEYLTPDAYDLRFMANYVDIDNNKYQTSMKIPFLVKPRPYLEVVNVEGEGLAGGSGKLYVTLKNTGSEDAESVDVRLIKQSAQPFSTDVRSDYLGVLAPNETGVAIFDIGIRRDAEPKEYDLKLLVRAKGDSDTGDDNIYTYNRNAKFDVTGKVPNRLLFAGLIGLILAIIIGISMVKRK